MFSFGETWLETWNADSPSSSDSFIWQTATWHPWCTDFIDQRHDHQKVEVVSFCLRAPPVQWSQISFWNCMTATEKYIPLHTCSIYAFFESKRQHHRTSPKNKQTNLTLQNSPPFFPIVSFDTTPLCFLTTSKPWSSWPPIVRSIG